MCYSVSVNKWVPSFSLIAENSGAEEVINLNFIVRIKEYPRKKNGKKKAVVLD